MPPKEGQFDYSVAVYLKNQGYVETLEKLLLESPNLRDLQVDEIDGSLSNSDYERLAQDLRTNSGAYTLLTQAIRQIESAVGAMKYGLRLSSQPPDNILTTYHHRFYNNHSTIPKYRNVTRNQQRYPKPKDTCASNIPTISNVQLRRTPIRQDNQGSAAIIVQVGNQLLNTTTPTRRQLFASPNKRKTPNPKQTLTPQVERDLLEEVMKQCLISPSDWDRRIIDSALPQQLAAVINTAREHSCTNTPRKECDQEISPAVQAQLLGDQLDDLDTDAVISDALDQLDSNPEFLQSLEQLFAPEYSDPDARAIEDEVNHFEHFRSPELSFLHSDSEATPTLAIAFDLSTTSSTVGNVGQDTPCSESSPNRSHRRILPKSPAVNRQEVCKTRPLNCVRRPLHFGSANDHPTERSPKRRKQNSLSGQQSLSSPSTSTAHSNLIVRSEQSSTTLQVTNLPSAFGGGPVINATPKTQAGDKEVTSGSGRSLCGKGSGNGSALSADLMTPDRIDALMKRLHKKN